MIRWNIFDTLMADKTKIQSRKVWREAGYNVENGEFIVQIGGGRKVKRDLFGFVDLVAIPKPLVDGGNGVILWDDEVDAELTGTVWPTIYIQVTSWSNVPARVRKILNETTGKGQWEVPMRQLADGLRAGGALILVEGWRKSNRGQGRSVWERRQHWFTEEELKP